MKSLNELHIAVVDNYDSFTFNLVHALEPFVNKVWVMRNDEIDLEKLNAADGILLSPGPGLPQDAGQMPAVISEFVQHKPFLGVCLGMQALNLHFGGELQNMEEVLHGRKFDVEVEPRAVMFKEIPQNTPVGLYHSWCCSALKIPTDFTVTARYREIPMAFEHRFLPVFGVQFHPESVMTESGSEMLLNWLKCVAKTGKEKLIKAG